MRHLRDRFQQLLIVVPLALIIGGCGGNHPPDSPPLDAALPASGTAATGDPIAQLSIGPAGGTLAAGGFKLVVPAKALYKDYTLKLYRVARTSASGLGCVSDTYEITGLPRTVSRALTVSFTPLAGEATKGFSFVNVGENAYAPSTGQKTTHRPITARVASGRLLATIAATPPLEAGAPDLEMGTLQDAPASVRLSAFSRWRALTSPGGRFRVIFHPSSCSESSAALIANSAEAAQGLLENPYGFMWGRRTAWPVDIEVRALADGIAAFVPSRWSGVNGASLEVNSANTGSDAEVRAIGPAIEHEVCHLAQSLYDPRNRWSAATASGPWYWMDEATATEFEYQRGTQLGAPGAQLPIPDTVTSNLGFVVNHSLEYPPGDFLKVRRHGYGAAAFIHSCIPHMGLGGLGALYTEHYYNPSYTPVQCLDDQLTTWSLDSAFVAFVDQWVRGTVYFGTQFPDPSEVLAERANTPVLGTNQPTALFERKVGDLSIWPILIKRAETPPGSDVKVFGRISGLAYGEHTELIYRFAKQSGHGTLTRMNSSDPLRIDNFELGLGTLLVIVNHAQKLPYISTPTVTVGLQVQPKISRLMPAGGKAGTLVVIEGYGFGNSPGNIDLDGESIEPTAWSGTRIDFVVPKLMGTAGTISLRVDVPGPSGPSICSATEYFTYDPGI